MDKLVVKGRNRLRGEVTVSGAKTGIGVNQAGVRLLHQIYPVAGLKAHCPVHRSIGVLEARLPSAGRKTRR